MSPQFSIRGDFNEDDARERIAGFFPGDVKIAGYIVLGFVDGDPAPHLSSNAGSASLIIACLSAALFGLTHHEISGEPAAPEDMLEIPYRAGAETRSLACPGCGCIGWERTPTGVSCGGCGAAYSGQEIKAMIDKAIGDAS